MFQIVAFNDIQHNGFDYDLKDKHLVAIISDMSVPIHPLLDQIDRKYAIIEELTPSTVLKGQMPENRIFLCSEGDDWVKKELPKDFPSYLITFNQD